MLKRSTRPYVTSNAYASSSVRAQVWLCILQWADIPLAERRNDFGKHIYGLEDPADNTIEFLKILYIYLIGYFSATSFVKLAM